MKLTGRGLIHFVRFVLFVCFFHKRNQSNDYKRTSYILYIPFRWYVHGVFWFEYVVIMMLIMRRGFVNFSWLTYVVKRTHIYCIWRTTPIRSLDRRVSWVVQQSHWVYHRLFASEDSIGDRNMKIGRWVVSFLPLPPPNSCPNSFSENFLVWISTWRLTHTRAYTNPEVKGRV